MVDKTVLLQRQQEAQTKFDELTGQINNLEQQIQPLAEERVKVQGEHRVLTELLANADASATPTEGDVVEPTQEPTTDQPTE